MFHGATSYGTAARVEVTSPGVGSVGTPRPSSLRRSCVPPCTSVHCPVSNANGPVITRWSPGRPSPPMKSGFQIAEVLELSTLQSQYGSVTEELIRCSSSSKRRTYSRCHGRKAEPRCASMCALSWIATNRSYVPSAFRARTAATKRALSLAVRLDWFLRHSMEVLLTISGVEAPALNLGAMPRSRRYGGHQTGRCYSGSLLAMARPRAASEPNLS